MMMKRHTSSLSNLLTIPYLFSLVWTNNLLLELQFMSSQLMLFLTTYRLPSL
jgi:hypothetical protein